MLLSNKHIIKLIDYGLSKKANPLPQQSSSLIGSARYASRGAHQGLSSKMDDLEKFILCDYLFSNGTAPMAT